MLGHEAAGEVVDVGADVSGIDPTQIVHTADHYTKQSHELRVSSPAEYRQAIETCQRAAQRMRRLIESLLQLARLDAHRLIAWAQQRGDALATDLLLERLFRAYFIEGRLLSDREELIRIASDAGLPEDEARLLLASTAGLSDVEAEDHDPLVLFHLVEDRGADRLDDCQLGHQSRPSISRRWAA